MSKKTFGHIAQRLAALGYEPVPIIRGEKRPAADGWQAGGWEAKAQDYERCFTGFLTRHTPSVDIDVSDEPLVKQIRAIVYDVTGCHETPPPRRIGNAPRELLVFRTEEPFPKVSTAAYVMSTDKPDENGKVKGSKVEILADGQQFVGYAIHPTTNEPYKWNGGGEPLEVERTRLITLDEAQAKEIITRCEVLLSLHGERVEREAMARGPSVNRVSAERQTADDPILAMAALGNMPNPNIPFDDWLRVLYATKGGLGEEGHDVFMLWSARSSKHDPAFAEKEWRKAKPTKIGAGSLIYTARLLGWTPTNQVTAPASTPSCDVIDEDGVITSLVWPHMSGGKTPRPLNTIENLQAMADHLGVRFALNVISGREHIYVPGLNVDAGFYDNAAITWLMSEAARLGLPAERVPDYASMLCARNGFNPVAQWVDSKPWDGVSRIGDLCDTLDSDGDKALKETLVRKWLISAIASAYRSDGTSSHGVLVLLGDQNIGKTSWFKRLTPQHLGLSKDGMILRPDDKDSVKQVTSFWLVELGELDATFRKSDIAALKAFITMDHDVFRAAYARKETYKPRRTVFFASVNEDRFLSDPTGNRRYWTINCKSINYNHDIDMQQLWAEVKVLFDNGESWYLDNDTVEQLNSSNDDFTTIDPILEMLSTKLDWASDQSTWTWKTATETLELCGFAKPSRSDVTTAGRVLRQLAGVQHVKRSHGVTKTLSPKLFF